MQQFSNILVIFIFTLAAVVSLPIGLGDQLDQDAGEDFVYDDNGTTIISTTDLPSSTTDFISTTEVTTISPNLIPSIDTMQMLGLIMGIFVGLMIILGVIMNVNQRCRRKP